MIAHSVLAFAEAVKQEEKTKKSQAALDKIAKLLAGTEGKKFLAACKTLLPEPAAKLEAKNLKEPVGVWLDFFRAKKDVFTEALPILGAHAATLYVGTCQAAEATTMSIGQLGRKNTRNRTEPRDAELMERGTQEPKGSRAISGAAWQNTTKAKRNGVLLVDHSEETVMMTTSWNVCQRANAMRRQTNLKIRMTGMPSRCEGHPKKKRNVCLSVNLVLSQRPSRTRVGTRQRPGSLSQRLMLLWNLWMAPKALKITHEGLVTLFGTVPEAALQHHMLDKRLVALKKLTKLPKAETLTALLRSLKELGEAAVAKTAKGREVLKVHRVNGLTADGRAAVQDSERVDEVELEAAETIRQATRRLFVSANQEEDLENWNIKILEEGGLIKTVDTKTTLASEHPEVVLVRKGGYSPLWSKVHACRLEEALVESHQVSGCLSIDHAFACVVLR